MKFDFQRFAGPQFWKRFWLMLFGIFFMGFFLSFLRKVSWGLDPYTFQNENIRQRLGWTLGNWQLLLNAILFVVVVVFDRRLIGLGTIFNWVLIGYTADFFTWLWTKLIPQDVFTAPSFLWLKVLIFVFAILLFITSASVYMNADSGLSPYDAVAYIISQKLNRIPFFICRICYDLFAIAVGIVSTIGTSISFKTSFVGSFVMALLLGPAIQLVGRFINKYILKTNEVA
ncbi:MAG: hypothetical protein J1D88_00705 [Treponema sp.]|nr:hypothetical protein [Treponema sp.]